MSSWTRRDLASPRRVSPILMVDCDLDDGDRRKAEKLGAWCGGWVSRQVEAEKSGK